MKSDVGSKTLSSNWVKNDYAPQWKSLIEEADKWRHGDAMKKQEETIEFLKFVLDKVPSPNEDL